MAYPPHIYPDIDLGDSEQHNMFSGPCFGDLTPSEDSVVSTVEGPTPTPFCLDTEPRSSKAPLLPTTEFATLKEDSVDGEATLDILDDGIPRSQPPKTQIISSPEPVLEEHILSHTSHPDVVLALYSAHEQLSHPASSMSDNSPQKTILEPTFRTNESPQSQHNSAAFEFLPSLSERDACLVTLELHDTNTNRAQQLTSETSPILTPSNTYESPIFAHELSLLHKSDIAFIPSSSPISPDHSPKSQSSLFSQSSSTDSLQNVASPVVLSKHFDDLSNYSTDDSNAHQSKTTSHFEQCFAPPSSSPTSVSSSPLPSSSPYLSQTSSSSDPNKALQEVHILIKETIADISLPSSSPLPPSSSPVEIFTSSPPTSSPGSPDTSFEVTKEIGYETATIEEEEEIKATLIAHTVTDIGPSPTSSPVPLSSSPADDFPLSSSPVPVVPSVDVDSPVDQPAISQEAPISLSPGDDLLPCSPIPVASTVDMGSPIDRSTFDQETPMSSSPVTDLPLSSSPVSVVSSVDVESPADQPTIDLETQISSGPVSDLLPSSSPIPVAFSAGLEIPGGQLAIDQEVSTSSSPSTDLFPSSSPIEVASSVDKHLEMTLLPTNTVVMRTASKQAVSPSTSHESVPLKIHEQSSSSPSTVTPIAPASPVSLNKRKHNQEDAQEIEPLKSVEIPVPGPKEDEKPSVQSPKIKDIPVPTPKRPTVASRKFQSPKLTAPFRSPVMKRPKLATHTAATPISSPLSSKKSLDSPSTSKLPAKSPQASVTNRDATPETSKIKHRTVRAAAQFKSPLSSGASSTTVSSVRLTPTIQALERRLQALKRAIKVKHDGEEEILEGLVKKWTDAGREIAWEVWSLVKDMGGGESSAGTEKKGLKSGGGWGGDQWGDKREGGAGKRGFEDAWGWDEKGDTKKRKIDEGERNWGWDVSSQRGNDGDGDQVMGESYEHHDGNAEAAEEEEEEEESRQDTLGTMLKQLGIAPETLGWNEDEGEFIDEIREG